VKSIKNNFGIMNTDRKNDLKSNKRIIFSFQKSHLQSLANIKISNFSLMFFYFFSIVKVEQV